MAKMTQADKNNLLCLIDHVRSDLSYREGGTFVDNNDENEVNKDDVRKVENAINFIKRLIILG